MATWKGHTICISFLITQNIYTGRWLLRCGAHSIQSIHYILEEWKNYLISSVKYLQNFGRKHGHAEPFEKTWPCGVLEQKCKWVRQMLDRSRTINVRTQETENTLYMFPKKTHLHIYSYSAVFFLLQKLEKKNLCTFFVTIRYSLFGTGNYRNNGGIEKTLEHNWECLDRV